MELNLIKNFQNKFKNYKYNNNINEIIIIYNNNITLMMI